MGKYIDVPGGIIKFKYYSSFTYQTYTAYSKEELNKNYIFNAKNCSVLYSCKI